LGVSDIRIISSAQYNTLLENAKNINEEVYVKYPILKYRIENLNRDRNVRGLQKHDSHRCHLMLDDMAIAGNYNFPCIIYMREGGDPVGKVGENMRQERAEWIKNNDTHCNEICRKNCLDVCIDYNNRYQKFKIEECSLEKIDSTNFTWDKWRAGSIKDFNIPCRFISLTSEISKRTLREYAIGWAWGENLMCRPKENEVAVMFYKDEEYFWFHLRRNEFYEIFI